jgi:hypothetical protein
VDKPVRFPKINLCSLQYIFPQTISNFTHIAQRFKKEYNHNSLWLHGSLLGEYDLAKAMKAHRGSRGTALLFI